MRAFADAELQNATQAIIHDSTDQAHVAWYTFARHQKNELNKDINFYEIELDDLIKRDDIEKFLEQFKEIRSSLQNMYNLSTMSFRLCGERERPAPSARIPTRPDLPARSQWEGQEIPYQQQPRNSRSRQGRYLLDFGTILKHFFSIFQPMIHSE